MAYGGTKQKEGRQLGLLSHCLRFLRDQKRHRLDSKEARLKELLGQSGDQHLCKAATVYGKATKLGIRVDIGRACDLVRNYDSLVPDKYYQYAFSADDAPLVSSLATRKEEHVLAACIAIAQRLKLSDTIEAAARRLALRYAETANAEPLLAHLERCRQWGLVSVEFLQTVLGAYTQHRTLADNVGWAYFLSELSPMELPDLFDVHLVLRHGADAARLADKLEEKHKALQCCMESDDISALLAAVNLAEQVNETKKVREAHNKLGKALVSRGNIDTAIGHFRKAGEHLRVSECYEQLGNYIEAFRACPPDNEQRLLSLLGPNQQGLVKLTEENKHKDSVNLVQRLLGHLERVPDKSSQVQAKVSSLRRYRDAILRTVRTYYHEITRSANHHDRCVAYRAWSEIEEAAGEIARAAQLAEEAGDYLRASLLWESDEKYGEALRALGPHAKQEAVYGRTAELMERGGDPLGAAPLYERIGQLEDAQRAYEAARDYGAAAHCLLSQIGEVKAADLAEFANLMRKAGLVEDLVRLYIRVVQSTGRESRAPERLRVLLGSPWASSITEDVRAEAEQVLESMQLANREAFDAQINRWVEQAREQVMACYAPAWGLDLGTTHCAVALFDLTTNTPIMCLWKGMPHFPSTIAIDVDGREHVGFTAEEMLSPNIRAGIVHSKRLMGTDKIYHAGPQTYRPEAAAARLIQHGRTIAESFLRQQIADRVKALAFENLGDVPDAWVLEVTEADRLDISLSRGVITIPAYFGFREKQATLDAAAISKVEVLRLLSEPTAACLSAGQTRPLKNTVTVLDLGAGTLDISIVEIADQVYQVKQVFGDNQFGGLDFDNTIAEQLVNDLKNKHGIDVPPKGLLRRRVQIAAEELKIQLSTAAHSSYTLRGVSEYGDVTLNLSRADLAELLSQEFRRFSSVCHEAANCRSELLLLVGAPMLSPLLRERAEIVFGMKAVRLGDPRTAVACGAAIQAAVMTAGIEAQLIDIVPFSLGVRVHKENSKQGVISVHIPRGSKVPVENADTYTTVVDNQTEIRVEAFQGESDDPTKNLKIGQFTLGGIPLAKAGVPKIKIRFAIDADGLLVVGAEDIGTHLLISMKISDTTMLSLREREEIAGRFESVRKSQQGVLYLDNVLGRLQSLIQQVVVADPRCAALQWRRQIKAYQSAPNDYAPNPAEQQTLYRMFNQPADLLSSFELAADLFCNMEHRVQKLTDAFKGASCLQDQNPDEIQRLLEEARSVESNLPPLVSKLVKYNAEFTEWNNLLSNLRSRIPDPMRRFLACHEVGQYEEARLALLGSEIPTLDQPNSDRYLDVLGRTRDRLSYRRLIVESLSQFGARKIEFDKLNEFCQEILPSIAWIQLRNGRGSFAQGSGFLVSDSLVATNRHVIESLEDSSCIAPASDIRVYVCGAWRAVIGTEVTQVPELDFALIRLAETIDACPLRIGYADLVQLGEQVVAVGFPLAHGEDFEQNVLIDAGLINRIRVLPSVDVRAFEVGIRANVGMSGGPVFNDIGEVIGVVSFLSRTVISMNGADAMPNVIQSAHALGADCLREMLPPRWKSVADTDGII
jgi:molecular chaperone DnaK